MIESVAPHSIATAARSIGLPSQKLANRLLGCTCAAALWLTGSVDELWAHEQHSHAAKQHEGRPQESAPNEQRARRQAHAKSQEDIQDRVHKVRHTRNQKTDTKPTQKPGLKIKSETKASKVVQHSRSKASARGNAEMVDAKSRVKHHRPDQNVTKPARSKSRSITAGRNREAVHTKSRTKTARSCRLETKKAIKSGRSKPARCSHSTLAGREYMKSARAKSRTKTIEHRRQQAKSASRSHKQWNIAGHQHSAADTRGDKSMRGAKNRRSRIKTVQHRTQHEAAAKNSRASTASAKMAAVTAPVSSPRPTPPVPLNRKPAVIAVDPALTVGLPGAGSAERAEDGPDTHSELRPADQIPQPIQPSDRAAILERGRLGMHELPKELQELMPNNPPPAQEVVNEARAYLVRTSFEQRERCVGDTMARQGVEVAIGRLHPVMAVRVARSIDQARNEGIPACVYSAFRPPAFGVGGFSDKYNSAHAYGIAVDFGGIDRPGSRNARRFQEIAASNGLYSLYGPGDRAEWNHYQLIPVRRIAPNNPLRDTITANGPKDQVAMWIKSGVPLDKVEPVAFRAENAVISARTKVSHHHSQHRQHMAALKVAPLSPFVRVQQTTATKALPLSPFMRVM
jgi:hypothetical protein